MPEPATPGTGIQVNPERLLPLPITGSFFGIGLLVFASIPVLLWQARGLLAAGWYADHDVLLLVHMYALGWGTSVALGAWQQLSVVALQVPGAPNVKPAWASLAFFVIGLPALLTGFHGGRPLMMAVGGTLLVAAFIAAITTSVHARAAAQRGSVLSSFVAGALLSLVAVGVVGVMLAINRSTGWLGQAHVAALKSHLYLGPVGWFGLLIPGVSYELAPFFGITRAGNDPGRGKHPRLVVALIAIGVFGGLGAALLGFAHPLLLLPLAVGYLLFVVDLRGIFRKRGEIRRTATLTGVRASHAWLLAGSLLLLAASLFAGSFWNYRWTMSLAWIAAAGWIANAVAGYLHRILPFLLWHHRYWGKKKEEVKTSFPRMVDQKLGRIGFWVYNAGALGVLAGLWYEPLLAVAIVVYGVGVWALCANLAQAYWK